MIDSYGFGRIVVDQQRYTSDVIVFADRVKDSWWRREGHRLHVEDIERVVHEEKPDVLVVGTGYSGLMKVLPETEKYLKSNGIELIAQDTREACKTFNRLVKSRKVIAALHLTC
ncbi:MAG: Mth938-like domain-containing protein [Candidatus Bathyarchaeota archaeon]|nr:MAG: Mth938-like domain-containing protein [Candidatus Bathyarchaeota archaeon]